MVVPQFFNELKNSAQLSIFSNIYYLSVSYRGVIYVMKIADNYKRGINFQMCNIYII